MVCLAGNQVWWTWEVEDVFRKVKKGAKTALKDYAKRLHGQIDKLVVKVRTGQGYLCKFNVKVTGAAKRQNNTSEVLFLSVVSFEAIKLHVCAHDFL